MTSIILTQPQIDKVLADNSGPVPPDPVEPPTPTSTPAAAGFGGG